MTAASCAAALACYQSRAQDSERSFEHMVLLEAAVQGWCDMNVCYICSVPSCHLLQHCSIMHALLAENSSCLHCEKAFC